jgi:PAS domain S-box-containing protein
MIIRTREGTKIPVELSISKVNIDDKVNFMCIIRDISNREKRERELRMQKEFLQETQKTANVGGFETDFSTNTLKLSNETYRIFDVPFGQNPKFEEWVPIIHPEDRPKLLKARKKLKETGESYNLELRIIPDEDTLRLIRIIGNPQYNDDDKNKPSGISGIIQDITEQKEIERDLYTKSKVIDDSPVGITIADSKDNSNPITYINNKFEDLTGYSKESVIGKNCRFLQGKYTDEETVKDIRQAIESEEPIQVEIINYRSDGTPFWNQLTLFPVNGVDTEEVEHYVGIQEDITAQKRRERLINVMDRILRHNLRNDMNVIMGLSNIIKKKTDGDISEESDKISKKADNLITLSNKLRSFEKAFDDDKEFKIISIDKEIKKTISRLRKKYPDIDFISDIEKGCNVKATDELGIALEELGDNAAKYASNGKIIFKTEISENNNVHIKVKDSGPGIPEAEKEVLETGEETPLSHGLGIGLWMVNWIITGLGGHISTEFNNGTTVDIGLPLQSNKN